MSAVAVNSSSEDFVSERVILRFELLHHACSGPVVPAVRAVEMPSLRLANAVPPLIAVPVDHRQRDAVLERFGPEDWLRGVLDDDCVQRLHQVRFARAHEEPQMFQTSEVLQQRDERDWNR